MMPLSFCLFLKFYCNYSTFILSHSFSTVIYHHSLRFLSISSTLVSSVGKTSLGCQAKYRTQACKHQADSLPTELRRILLNYAAL
jgi:hypothetical protein